MEDLTLDCQRYEEENEDLKRTIVVLRSKLADDSADESADDSADDSNASNACADDSADEISANDSSDS